jgi:rare lipoprotein A
MKVLRPVWPVLALCALLTMLSSCSTTTPPASPSTPKASGHKTDGPPSTSDVPDDILSIPEPVPKNEPRSPYGNPDQYEVFGVKYRVLKSAEGFKETGLASWYGRKFHGRRTSSGETYDMFKLTAAHKTLPLPSYVRVTNVANGRSCIVRVNDRGPFHSDRIIDLSYAAAARLELLDNVGAVEIQAVTPGPAPTQVAKTETSATAAKPFGGFLQVAAYADPINAISLREQLTQLGFTPVEIRTATLNGDPMHRVLLGPYRDQAAVTQVRDRLQVNGLDGYQVIN